MAAKVEGCTGIVGTGAIGTMTARLFRLLVPRLLPIPARFVRVEEMGISYVSLETLMAQSDIVSLHLPSNPQTKGMISRAMLQKMKPTAILINVARGAVVDNTALAEALNQEKIAGAGIDVFDMEPPLPETYPLLRAKHTVLTPHVAFATEESMLRRAEIVFRNVEAYLDGCPENVCPL
ncbi:MAG: NAD(P)-dependent oxidoreductase [Evtepia gabavorous]